MTSTSSDPETNRRLQSQLEAWRTDLLNLDRRQKLVYFKHTRTASFEIATPAPLELHAALASGLPIRSLEEKSSGRSLLIRDKSPAEVTAGCRRLDLTAQQVFADRGFWTLYVGLGILEWIDPADGRSAHAPIVLVPVDLKKMTRQTYRVQRNDDDVVVNPALRLRLERDFAITLPQLELDDPDVSTVMTELARSVESKSGWSVHERSVLTTFSFHKEAIYRDLTDHQSTILEHPIVQLVGLGADAPNASSFGFAIPGRDRSIDDLVDPEDLVNILDADSSQRTCILAARDGHSFVMDGPPGTGKSQTISNIIAELISTGKRVLFVSEKAAALDVVRNRLSEKGIGEFLLELHSHAATRKEVVKQLDDALGKRISPRGAMSDGDRAQLRSIRKELSQFANAMNANRAGMDQSLYEVLGRLLPLEEQKHVPLAEPDQWRHLSRVDFERLLASAEGLGKAWRPVTEGDDFLWRDLGKAAHTSGQVHRIRNTTKDVSRAIDALIDRIRAVDANLSLSWPIGVSTTRRRIELLKILESRPDFPAHWLSHSDLGGVRRRSVHLRESIGFHNVARAQLELLIGVGQADQIDLDQCNALNSNWSGLPWAPPQEMTNVELSSAAHLLAEAPVVLAEILEKTRVLCGILGISNEAITLDRATEVAELAMLGGGAALPEKGWLNPSVQAALDESTRVLGSVVEVVNAARTSIEQVFTSAALETDLTALEVRFREAHTGLRSWGGSARRDRRLLKSITVSGRSDKSVRARLADAVAWQAAERSLQASEKNHAARLGSYWDGASTDFGRISAAIATARRAIDLAGNDLNGGRMGDQLARGGEPDPRLTILASQVLEAATQWIDRIHSALGTTAGLPEESLSLAAARTQEIAAALRPMIAAIDHIASVAGREVQLVEARQIRTEAAAVNETLVAIYNRYSDDQAQLGSEYEGLSTDWSRIDAGLDCAAQVQDLLGGPALPRQVDNLRAPVVLAEELHGRFEDYERHANTWVTVFTESRAGALREDMDADLVSGSDLVSAMHETCTTDIDEWDAYVRHSSDLVRGGLGETLEHLRAVRANASTVRPSVEWAILQAWTEGTISNDRRLTVHRAVERDDRAARFNDLDQNLVRRSNVAVAAACSARRPASLNGTSAQLIRREAQKKSRHLPIRKLLAQTREVVQALKPCFMMSPLSVSQFLPGDMSFDVVIFDEASQVLPSDAVNCIYRGKQLIVAGDEKQLPPTSFFAQAVSDDDVDEELDLFESLLKSCKSSLTSIPLTWHYRSQHESLITFSNHSFYRPDGQSLQTFPSAAFVSPDLGVAAFHVENAVYRRGTTRDNPAEAEAVVDRLLFHRENHPNLSIGVVTFSSAQENAIADALERRSLTEPRLAGMLDNHDRLSGFFIKNLENVQGDERDIIVFSIGYGRGEEGNLLMNFGPVTREGGWRRLNVAITRARRRVEVVSSFRASEIREGSNESLKYLKGYLDFAARGTSSLDSAPEDDRFDSGATLENDVLEAVRSWGYDVDRRIGNSDYRLDLAVRHPDRAGEYVMAIECDGEPYDSASSARDRDRLRGSVLRSLGWNLFRVWGIAWHHDRDKESARLRASIECAVSGNADPVRTLPPASIDLEVDEIDFDAPPPWAAQYEVMLGGAMQTGCRLADVEARPAIRAYVEKLIVAEGPIHQDVVFRRIRDAFGTGRIGHNIRANIEFVTTRLSIDGRSVTIDDSGFYRHGSAQSVRVPADEDAIRTVGQTPPEELDLAVVNLVRDAVVVSDDDLVVAVRNLFGWRRAGTDIQLAVLVAVDRCVASGSIRRSHSGELRAR